MYPVTHVTIPKEGCVAQSNTVCCSSLRPLRGIHDKQACPTAWLGLASCPAFMYPSSKLRQNRDEEKVRGGRLTKLEAKQGREKQSQGEGLKTKQHSRSPGNSAHKTMDWKLMGWSYT